MLELGPEHRASKSGHFPQPRWLQQPWNFLSSTFSPPPPPKQQWPGTNQDLRLADKVRASGGMTPARLFPAPPSTAPRGAQSCPTQACSSQSCTRHPGGEAAEGKLSCSLPQVSSGTHTSPLSLAHRVLQALPHPLHLRLSVCLSHMQYLSLPNLALILFCCSVSLSLSVSHTRC